ncbi:hypothetical protein [Paenilisteria rocourtiae]|uniref:DUF1642 domain-containing protein n=1 Tax=Listeria rocourtiae TaxID=647910 RepID=A0A4R6ZFH2_9LIST|nr:hypothetical protein [Listeria rocourtiae]EUJ48625.1 hypothetical protein PROCOU_05393 [Listeria rocourtiae FSL F6-920]TDR50835.1 hypothetical protein DFP96_11747 [Listeria rocourtiae]
MKTVEFKQAVEGLGFNLGKYVDDDSQLRFRVYDDNGKCIGSVYKDSQYTHSIYAYNIKELGEEKTHKLAELLFEYASTPLDEREEPKKWYLRDPVTTDDVVLNICKSTGRRIWNTKADTGWYKNQFTRAEIEAFTFPAEHLIEVGE